MALHFPIVIDILSPGTNPDDLHVTVEAETICSGYLLT
jgi:hypothetical protein